MAHSGDAICQLAQKIDVLVEAMFEMGKISRASRPNFATLANISYPTLKSACAVGKISEELVANISKACGVRLEGITWIDRRHSPEQRWKCAPDYQGADRASAFRVNIRDQLGLPIHGRFRLAGDQSEALDAMVASIALSDLGQTTTSEQPMSIFLQIDMAPLFDANGYKYGFEKARIRLVPSSELETAIVKRLGNGAPVKLGDSVLHARGTDVDPQWDIVAEGRVLHGEYSTKDEALCAWLEVKLGDELHVELLVSLHDGSLRLADGTPPKPGAKEKLIQRVLAKRLKSDPDYMGWIMLGKHKIRVKRVEG